jgi:hypothetical protein
VAGRGGVPPGPEPVRAPVAEPVAAPRALRKRQFRGKHVVAAVLMIVLGGVLAGAAFFTATRSESVLVVARQVPAGSVLTGKDLRVAQLNTQGLPAVRASDRGQVLGKRTTVTLLRDQLLMRGAVTSAKVLQPGQQQVGILLDQGRMPAERLHPGDRVLLLETPDTRTYTAPATGQSGQTAGQDTDGPLGQWDAAVVSSTPPTENSPTAATVLYVAVLDADAPRIGMLAVSKRLIVTLVGAR